MSDLIAFMANSEAEKMYYHQAMKQPDQNQFREAMVKDFNNHTDGNNFKLVTTKEVPTRTKIIYAIW